MQYENSQIFHSLKVGLLSSTLLLCSACHGFFSGSGPSEGEKRPTAIAGVTPSQSLMIVSKKGETLSHIARKYTGAAKNWTKIAKANPQINPQKLKVGQKISIPETLVLASLRETNSDLVLVNTAQVSAFPREIKRASLKSTSAAIAEEELIPSAPSEPVAAEPSAKFGQTETALNIHRISQPLPAAPEKNIEKSIEKTKLIETQKSEEKEKLSPKERRQAERIKQASLRTTRNRVISSSGYGSLNREVSRLDAELAKAEALAAQARKQQSESKMGARDAAAEAKKDHFSCSKNKCSVK